MCYLQRYMPLPRQEDFLSFSGKSYSRGMSALAHAVPGESELESESWLCTLETSSGTDTTGVNVTASLR
jgi:hypothetical protein